MALAREEVMMNMSTWTLSLKEITNDLHLQNREVSCSTLLNEIIEKAFNAKANSVMKRYQSIFLARGGKHASQSTMREERKFEGKGRKADKKK